MKRKTVFETVIILLMLNMISALVPSLRGTGTGVNAPRYSDALVAPDLPGRFFGTVAASSPSPGYYETSEYLIGSVSVGVVLLESNGAVDPSTEDWNSTEESQVTSEIQAALDWWSDQNPSAEVAFSLSLRYRVPVSYEAINRPHTDQGLWISEAMAYLGYLGGNYFTQVRDYINDLRNYEGTDWAFAMFVVDSSNDLDGSFTDATPGGWFWFAYAYLGGPFLVMTYDNDGWGIDNMDRVAAHELGHIFYATDEYNGLTENSGYLNVSDVEGSGALMDSSNWWLSTGSREQIGWRDSDGDGLQDIVDTVPDTFLTPYSPDPTINPNLVYTGTVLEIPYPNRNPYGTGRDVTINTIANVEFRVDGASWQNATSNDGVFDEAEESFSLATQPLSVGTHTIETRGTDSVGNVETSYAIDVVSRQAATWHVPTDYVTIQEAINAAGPGDTIHVHSGTYYENIVVNKTLSIVGENMENTLIDGGFLNTVIYVMTNNVFIDGFTIRNGGDSHYGILVEHSSNASISGNIITNNRWGVFLNSSSNNNTLFGNEITNNDIGIALASSVLNNVSGNIIANNDIDGVFLYSSSANNTFLGNTVANNRFNGFHFYSSSFNLVSENSIADNGYGLYLHETSDNRIYHNNFIDNVEQAHILGSNNVNVLDDGYPSGGNYWSDHMPIDGYSGISQEEFGSDGIVDFPYIVDVDNRDHYPLIKPYSGPYDIGITNITTTGTLVVQGYALNIAVEILNYGIGTENFNLTVYANTTIIQTIANIVVANRNSTTITFEWNTTGFAKGYYSISAYAIPVSGDMDPSDNNRKADNVITLVSSGHDVAVTDVISKNHVGQGFPLNIKVTTMNVGNHTETFNVTVSIGPISTPSQTVTLERGVSTTGEFELDTIGFPKGNYTVIASATQVSGETDTTDNDFAVFVVIAMVGDITGPDGVSDGKVDIRDIALVASKFGAIYPDPRYDPNCDLTGSVAGVADNKVDIRDIALAASHFGEIDP